MFAHPETRRGSSRRPAPKADGTLASDRQRPRQGLHDPGAKTIASSRRAPTREIIVLHIPDYTCTASFQHPLKATRRRGGGRVRSGGRQREARGEKRGGEGEWGREVGEPPRKHHTQALEGHHGRTGGLRRAGGAKTEEAGRHRGRGGRTGEY
ncbi:unnamed protein product [Prorocentrum cordatum]|uniref:Uncharacterized protein n=1 Tax=Prorocentrum cordatum TaxID=2364126 RepID=A0ABN9U382_9DINO|nr:unnamed protein product [Polarella glacialis]